MLDCFDYNCWFWIVWFIFFNGISNVLIRQFMKTQNQNEQQKMFYNQERVANRLRELNW